STSPAGSWGRARGASPDCTPTTPRRSPRICSSGRWTGSPISNILRRVPNRRNSMRRLITAVCVFALTSAVLGVDTQSISLHPDNGHYLLFRGKPTVLITSGEHYGAVLNGDFD